MEKVYLVAEGEYSDYGIKAAYADKQLAEEHVELLNKGQRYPEAFVEEYVLREETPVLCTKYIRRVDLDKTTGDVTHEEDYHFVVVEDKEVLHQRPQVFERDGATRSPHLTGVHNIAVWGYDKQAVDKVYGERVAKARAEIIGL